MRPANNDRRSGWARIKDLLSYDINRDPKLFVFSNCVESIKTLEDAIYTRKGNHLWDMDEGCDDHLPEALRYCLMGTRDYIVPAVEKTEIQKRIERITTPELPKNVRRYGVS